MKTALIVGGGVVLAGGFAFYFWKKTHAAVVASAAPPSSAPVTRAPAPGAPGYVRAAGTIGNIVGNIGGNAIQSLLPVPGLGRLVGAYDSTLYSQTIAGYGEEASGVKSLVTGHPVDAAKSIATGVKTVTLAPTKAAIGTVKTVGSAAKSAVTKIAHLF
jgi:hypothetical protein